MRDARRARVERKTRETEVVVELGLDGEGRSNIHSGVPFLDHMLELFSKHGFFDLTVEARGDLAVDDHHTVEDIGICLGQALSKALGDKMGIRRFGSASVPLDEALGVAVVDVSGRAYLALRGRLGKQRVGTFDPALVQDFFQALASNAALTIHLTVPYGRNAHHKIECLFKAFSRALADAVSYDARQTGVPSTKGMI
ncbi:MAG: imidazoleglycerol-phosphate dehydratase HisB [Planctomycetes bacterium]|nr:imidazoleglycerol-phosphate dehydratase HisB [Planctomycetota bacterium]